MGHPVRWRENVWEADGDADAVAARGVAATEANGDADAAASTEAPGEAGAWADWLEPADADAFAAT